MSFRYTLSAPSASSFRHAALALLALCASVAAHAHTTGHVTSFVQGLLHPMTGMDHLAAFLTVGMWSALGAKRWWLAPAVFIASLMGAATLAPLPIMASATEPMVAASLLVLGLLMATSARLPAGLGLALIAGFGCFHGLAHGVELSGNASLGGILLGSLGIHALGLGLGLAMRERSLWLPRSVGASIALIGLATGWTLLAA